MEASWLQVAGFNLKRSTTIFSILCGKIDSQRCHPIFQKWQQMSSIEKSIHFNIVKLENL